jgi:hypothetical protein
LLGQESAPPAATYYIKLRATTLAAAKTGIFVPKGFIFADTIDIIVYLHGFKITDRRSDTIQEYWNKDNAEYGADYGKLREGVTASGRNVILAAPSLGAKSQAEILTAKGGLDAYLNGVLAALGANANGGRIPMLGDLVLASHSGGGLKMREIVRRRDKSLARLKECWGYDCTYNHDDDTEWAKAARERIDVNFYFYYITKSATATQAVLMDKEKLNNLIVQPAATRNHFKVPITHWRERLVGGALVS